MTKIQMEAVETRLLDNYIDEDVVPFAVCASANSKISKRQQRYLEKYYDRVVDKGGRTTFYCNVMNAWKCRDMGYKSIEFPNGDVKAIKQYNLEKNDLAGGKYVVVSYFSQEDKIDSISLAKMVRLKVEEMKATLNDNISR